MRRGRFNFLSTAGVAVVFVLLAIALLGQNSWKMNNRTERVIAVISGEDAEQLLAEEDEDTATCLYVWESADANSVLLYAQMPQILSDMKVDYVTADVSTEALPALSEYDTVILGVANCGNIAIDWLEDIRDWISDGGQMLIAQVMEYSSSSVWLYQLAGVQSMGPSYYETPGVRFVDDTMLYGDQTDYPLEASYDSSYSVQLEADCSVHLVTSDDNAVPLIWERSIGEGKVVTVNLGIYDKAYRGFYSSAYSYLGETCAWPVINAAVWYLDDFPSPVPEGNSEYIQRDYNMDIATFYTQVWWEDLSRLAEEYGIRYTGLVIEEYSDQTEGPFEENAATGRFQYFGNLLLSQGGEIGLHGYNHMPLVLWNFEYTEEYSTYETWSTVEDMKESLEALIDFCETLYPAEEFTVYVPPSNILSEEGRTLLAEEFDQVVAIASVYLPGDLAYEQEFEVAEDGMVETPRTISGYLLGDHAQLTALSELNFHYVSSHFQHPDDVMDVDRGAEMGWENMFSNLVEYVDWVYTASEGEIRSLTGSEMAAAVQRFYYVDVESNYTEEGLALSLDNFYDEAWLMIRFNDWEPGEVTGGELTLLTGNLYLLEAAESQVTIYKR
ncbi:MAG: DUF2194 domain-containing protein [Lachnospiraceae bacterium]|nr:DUF2194 domain-containing protein [Lachnospiraceae bacterium]